jgi:acetoin utilization deacetylase AcuC-like enzyme
MSVTIYSHPDCLAHDPGPGHVESPARLKSVLEALKNSPLDESLSYIDAPLGTDEQVLLAHTSALLLELKEAVPESGYAALDSDTVLSSGSLQAALRGTGAICQAIDDLVAGTTTSAFCATRPPGHHATPDTAMGFCLINHIAIGALYAQKKYGLDRIAVVDFDVHHGNGSQDILQDKEGILYISTHQSPLYPGTGQVGQNRKGNILNVPLPTGVAGDVYREVFTGTVLTALSAFHPQLVLVSAGFDAHHDDPLASLALREDDYQWLGSKLKHTANAYADGKIAAVLEGGYNLDALGSCVVAFVDGLVNGES